MNLQPMGPSPLTAGEKVLRVFCTCCGNKVSSIHVLCDLDAKPGTFYCQNCAYEQQLSEEELTEYWQGIVDSYEEEK